MLRSEDNNIVVGNTFLNNINKSKMVLGLVVVIGSKMLQNLVVCWQKELPIAGIADVKAKCSSGVKSYHV